nr:hypothetical protein BaRGS_027628 [Batillaria attramentaria]
MTPNRPTGNQHVKSDMTMANSRRAIAMSRERLVESAVDMLVGLDGPVNDDLSHSNEQEEDEVENDHDAEGIRMAMECVSGDG